MVSCDSISFQYTSILDVIAPDKNIWLSVILGLQTGLNSAHATAKLRCTLYILVWTSTFPGTKFCLYFFTSGQYQLYPHPESFYHNSPVGTSFPSSCLSFHPEDSIRSKSSPSCGHAGFQQLGPGSESPDQRCLWSSLSCLPNSKHSFIWL